MCYNTHCVAFEILICSVGSWVSIVDKLKELFPFMFFVTRFSDVRMRAQYLNNRERDYPTGGSDSCWWAYKRRRSRAPAYFFSAFHSCTRGLLVSVH